MATAIPLIAALVATGGTVYAANQAKKAPKNEKEMRKAIYAQLFKMMPEGERLLGEGNKAMESNLDYWNKSADGSRQEVDQLLNPMYLQQGQQTRNAMRAAQEMGVGGGASAAGLNAALQNASNNASMALGQRNFARDKQLQTAGGLSQMGYGLMSGGQGTGMGMLNLGMQQRNQDAQLYGQLGQGLGSALSGAYGMYNAGRTPTSQQPGGYGLWGTGGINSGTMNLGGGINSGNPWTSMLNLGQGQQYGYGYGGYPSTLLGLKG